jgi:gamma-glutamyltranspeptidase/glutathione hydrolase
VVTRHHLASDVGAKVLKEGGNAFDSAIAVAFALAVVNPSAGNLGGGGFVVYYKNKKFFTIDYREKAPIKASRDMYLNSEGDVIKGLSLESYLASGIPGTVAGLIQLHKDEASMPLEKLIAPAIVLANEGFQLSEFQAQYLNKYAKKFKKNKEAKKIFVKERGWQKGDLLIQKDLAKSLSLIAKNGAKAFYDGDITERILDDFKKNEGIFIKEDFLSYEISHLPVLEELQSYRC